MHTVRRASVWLALVLIVVARPAGTLAWGFDGHRAITRRAIDALPPALRAFFAGDSGFVVAHVVDPDLWRVMNLGDALGPEDPNHYFNIDGLGERPPFDGVPRDRRQFLARYGSERAERTGRLPWRAADLFASLVAALRDAGNRATGTPATDARYFAAILAHYVEDAHVPFHAVVNHDGQLTNQSGIHARFETDLFTRYQSRLTLEPVHVRPVADMTAFMFDAIVSSAEAAPAVLDADRAADQGRRRYDDRYFAAFFLAAGPVLEARLSEAASGVASVWTAAWLAAGSPALGGRSFSSAPAATGRARPAGRRAGGPGER